MCVYVFVTYMDIWDMPALESKRGHMHVHSNYNLHPPHVASLNYSSTEQTQRCTTVKGWVLT